MEKISIARRHWERQSQKPLFPINNPDNNLMITNPATSPADINHFASSGFSSQPVRAMMETTEPVKALETNTCVLNTLCSLMTKEIDKEWTMDVISNGKKLFKINISPCSKKDFLTVKEAARIMQVSTHTVYHQLQQGNLKGLKVGRQWRVASTGFLS